MHAYQPLEEGAFRSDYVLQDARGGVYVLDSKSYDLTLMRRAHEGNGGIMEVGSSLARLGAGEMDTTQSVPLPFELPAGLVAAHPTLPVVASASTEGTVFIHDLTKGTVIAGHQSPPKMSVPISVTSLLWAPTGTQQLRLFVGYVDGSLREMVLVKRGRDDRSMHERVFLKGTSCKLRLIASSRPHDHPIVSILRHAQISTGKSKGYGAGKKAIVLTVSAGQEVFLFDDDGAQLDPLGFIKMDRLGAGKTEPVSTSPSPLDGPMAQGETEEPKLRPAKTALLLPSSPDTHPVMVVHLAGADPTNAVVTMPLPDVSTTRKYRRAQAKLAKEKGVAVADSLDVTGSVDDASVIRHTIKLPKPLLPRPLEESLVRLEKERLESLDAANTTRGGKDAEQGALDALSALEALEGGEDFSGAAQEGALADERNAVNPYADTVLPVRYELMSLYILPGSQDKLCASVKVEMSEGAQPYVGQSLSAGQRRGGKKAKKVRTVMVGDDEGTEMLIPDEDEERDSQGRVLCLSPFSGTLAAARSKWRSAHVYLFETSQFLTHPPGEGEGETEAEGEREDKTPGLRETAPVQSCLVGHPDLSLLEVDTLYSDFVRALHPEHGNKASLKSLMSQLGIARPTQAIGHSPEFSVVNVYGITASSLIADTVLSATSTGELVCQPLRTQPSQHGADWLLTVQNTYWRCCTQLFQKPGCLIVPCCQNSLFAVFDSAGQLDVYLISGRAPPSMGTGGKSGSLPVRPSMQPDAQDTAALSSKTLESTLRSRLEKESDLALARQTQDILNKARRLRNEYKTLMRQILQDPENAQLRRNTDFTVDSGLGPALYEEQITGIEGVDAQFAYARERAEKELIKARALFLGGGVEGQSLTVRGFSDSGLEVRTYRVSEVPVVVDEQINLLLARMDPTESPFGSEYGDAEGEREKEAANSVPGSRTASAAPSVSSAVDDMEREREMAQGGTVSAIARSVTSARPDTTQSEAAAAQVASVPGGRARTNRLAKVAARNAKRAASLKALQELKGRRPNPKTISTDDRRRIEYGKRHNGSRLLRTDPDYALPPRLSSSDARLAEYFILLRAYCDFRRSFNAKVEALSIAKQVVHTLCCNYLKIVAEYTRMIDSLTDTRVTDEINRRLLLDSSTLNLDRARALLYVSSDELSKPQGYTPAALRAYLVNRRLAVLAEEKAAKMARMGGFGGMAAGGDDASKDRRCPLLEPDYRGTVQEMSVEQMEALLPGDPEAAIIKDITCPEGIIGLKADDSQIIPLGSIPPALVEECRKPPQTMCPTPAPALPSTAVAPSANPLHMRFRSAAELMEMAEAAQGAGPDPLPPSVASTQEGIPTALPGTELGQEALRRVQLRVAHLDTERRRILSRADELMTCFDRTVKELVNQKSTLDVECGRVELKLVVLFKIVRTLLLFGKRDAQILREVAAKRGEKAALAKRLQSLQGKLSGIATKVEDLSAKRQALLTKLAATVPDDHPHHAALIAMFKKTVKQDAEGDQEDSDMSDMSDWSDISNEDGLARDALPEDITVETYDTVMGLQAMRQSIDDQLAASTAKGDQLRTQLGALKKQDTGLCAAVDQAQSELAVYESEKKEDLNALTTVAALSTGRVAALNMSRHINFGFDDYVLYTLSDLERLRSSARGHIDSIQDLVSEAKVLRDQYLTLATETDTQ
ncbi:hypothetical protein KIPB_003546, partial [Kipferlia bialata]|eukprot:g3546.t1